MSRYAVGVFDILIFWVESDFSQYAYEGPTGDPAGSILRITDSLDPNSETLNILQPLFLSRAYISIFEHLYILNAKIRGLREATACFDGCWVDQTSSNPDMPLRSAKIDYFWVGVQFFMSAIPLQSHRGRILRER